MQVNFPGGGKTAWTVLDCLAGMAIAPSLWGLQLYDNLRCEGPKWDF
jgi:hypothetical protein